MDLLREIMTNLGIPYEIVEYPGTYNQTALVNEVANTSAPINAGQCSITITGDRLQA